MWRRKSCSCIPTKFGIYINGYGIYIIAYMEFKMGTSGIYLSSPAVYLNLGRKKASTQEVKQTNSCSTNLEYCLKGDVWLYSGMPA